MQFITSFHALIYIFLFLYINFPFMFIPILQVVTENIIRMIAVGYLIMLLINSTKKNFQLFCIYFLISQKIKFILSHILYTLHGK